MKYFYLLALILAGCTELSREETRQINRALADSLLGVTETWGVDMNIYEDGYRVARIQSEYAKTRSSDETSESLLDGPVTVTVFDSLGIEKTVVTSKTARYESHAAEFEFEGEVIVINRDGSVLRSEYLEWTRSTETIRTDRFVTVTTARDSLAGFGLVARDDLSSYTFTRITGQFVIED